jgi:hypothetical protein
MQYIIIQEIQIAGFELDLYSPTEYPFVYWYMAHCLRMFEPHAAKLAASRISRLSSSAYCQAASFVDSAKLEDARSTAYGLLAEASLGVSMLSKRRLNVAITDILHRFL